MPDQKNIQNTKTDNLHHNIVVTIRIMARTITLMKTATKTVIKK